MLGGHPHCAGRVGADRIKANSVNFGVNASYRLRSRADVNSDVTAAIDVGATSSCRVTTNLFARRAVGSEAKESDAQAANEMDTIV